MRKEEKREVQEQEVICSKVTSRTFDEKCLEIPTLISVARILMMRINGYFLFPEEANIEMFRELSFYVAIKLDGEAICRSFV